MNKRVLNLGDRSLLSLMQKRSDLSASMSQLDQEIQDKLKQAENRLYQPVTTETMGDILEANLGTLKVSELTDMAGVSLQTYYNVKSSVDTVSISKLTSLLSVLGLQLYVGKIQINGKS